MAGEYTRDELLQMHRDLCEIEGLLQAKRRERGAYAKPGLADSVKVAEKLLLSSYDLLEQDVIASLWGDSDDVTTGRIAQADSPTEAEIKAALMHYDIPVDQSDKPVDRNRLAAILALILLWRRRQGEIALAQVDTLFENGHTTAMEKAGQTSPFARDAVAKLRPLILLDFMDDLNRLQTALESGKTGMRGLTRIVETAASVGAAAALIRDLFSRNRFRVEMFAEAIVWRAWMDGFRSGAVEATQAMLRTAGVLITPNLSKNDIPIDIWESLPRYQWSGPNDDKACQPCKDRFGDPVVALNVSDLPSPEEVCRFKRACRHFWKEV